MNYTGSFSRAYTLTNTTCPYTGTARPEYCSVSNWSTADLYVGYKGIKNLDLGITIQNIEGKNAPYDDRRLTRYTMYNPMFHNVLGRYATVRAKYSF
jgi:iron complex outermembrane receptor protein